MATDPIIIHLPGIPIGKGRPRFVRKTGVAFTPTKTRNYEAALRVAAKQAMRGRRALEGALAVTVTASFPTPPSWSKKKREAAGYVTARPDADNLLKTLDALNGVCWRDDAQVAHATVRKVYGVAPGLTVIVRALDD